MIHCEFESHTGTSSIWPQKWLGHVGACGSTRAVDRFASNSGWFDSWPHDLLGRNAPEIHSKSTKYRPQISNFELSATKFVSVQLLKPKKKPFQFI